MNDSTKPSVIQKLHSETAQIKWSELQRFFAQGSVLLVATELDLVATAVLFAEDEAELLEPLLRLSQVVAPSSEQAKQWFIDDALLWSVVVAPFVLVQE